MSERIPVNVLEADIDRCTNVYGVSPCTAGRLNSGTAQAGGASTITLAAGASAVNDFYKNMTVRITAGVGINQERKISSYVGATKVATVVSAWTTVPDATSVYDVIDRPNACRNTFKTCKDKANYVKGIKTFKFTGTGSLLPVGELMRPLITSVKVSPTELDLDTGLASRSVTTIVLRDAPDADVDTDPYLSDRASPPQGTFWTRFLARVHNYSMRPARLRRAALTGAWDWNAFTTELFVIESIKGPATNGDVTITLNDPVSLVNRVKVPTPTSGKLAVAFGTNDTQVTMNPGDGEQYPQSGYFRTGSQVIQYTGKKVANGWSFNGSLDGWTANNATLAANTTSITATGTAADPILRGPATSFQGGNYRYVIARIKRLAGAGWDGTVYYSTAYHGESGSYYKNIPDPTSGVAGDYVVAVWDMHRLSVGARDWQDGVILSIRLDLGAGAGDNFEIDFITYANDPASIEDVLFWPDGTYRSKFNTTAVPQKVGDGVQLCEVFIGMPVWQVLQRLYNLAGILDANIDLAGFQAEDEQWLGAKYTIDQVCLSEPEDIGVYLKELLPLCNASTWWASVEQKVKLRVLMPPSPAAVTASALTDEANFVQGSVKVDTLDNLRKTFVGVAYELTTAVANRKEAVNYLRSDLYIDADAESANEYGDRRMDMVMTRWFGASNTAAMTAWARRRLGQMRDAPKNVSFKLDPKDANIREGDYRDISTRYLVDADGAPKKIRCIVTKRLPNIYDIDVVARTTNFDRRYAFIGAAGLPDYGVANEAQRAYCYICNSSGKMSDGTDGYRII